LIGMVATIAAGPSRAVVNSGPTTSQRKSTL